MQPVEVLMVEDNRGDVVLVEEAMARLGLDHHVTVVPDGVEAVAYLQRQGRYTGTARPGLIILDLKLPRKSGLEVLDVIVADPGLRSIPRVIVSSSMSELELAREHALPGQRCLPKPSTFAGYVELLRTIEAFRRAMVPESTSATPA